MVDEEKLFFGVDERHELVPDEIRQLLELRKSGVMPHRVSECKKKNESENTNSSLVRLG